MTVNSWINPPSNIDGYVGFVYVVTEIGTGMKYIGIKTFYDNKTLPALKGRSKKDKKRLSKIKRNKRHVKKESNWKTYNTSSPLLQDKLENAPHNYEKRILRLCASITELKAWEAYIQLSYYTSGKWNELYNEVVNLRLRIRKE